MNQLAMFTFDQADASQLPDTAQQLCTTPNMIHHQQSCLGENNSIRSSAPKTKMAGYSKFLQDFSNFNSDHCNYYSDEEGINNVSILQKLSGDLSDEEEDENADIFEPIPLELAKGKYQLEGSLFSKVNTSDAKTMVNILCGDDSSSPSVHSSYVRSERFNIDNMPKNQFPYSSHPTMIAHFRQLCTNDRMYSSPTDDVTSQAVNANHCTMKRKYCSTSTIIHHNMPTVIPPPLCYNEIEQGAPKKMMTHFEENNYCRMNMAPVINCQNNKIDQSKQSPPSRKPQLKMKMRMIERHGQKTQIVIEPVYE